MRVLFSDLYNFFNGLPVIFMTSRSKTCQSSPSRAVVGGKEQRDNTDMDGVCVCVRFLCAY